MTKSLVALFIALAAVVGFFLSADLAGASGAGSTSGLACSTSVSGSTVTVTVTGMRSSTHVYYEAQLGSATTLGPFPPRATYAFQFFNTAPGSYEASVVILKGEGNPQGGVGGWTFYGVTTVSNLCSATVP